MQVADVEHSFLILYLIFHTVMTAKDGSKPDLIVRKYSNGRFVATYELKAYGKQFKSQPFQCLAGAHKLML